MSFFTYIVRCNDGSLYTGCTNNLEKRLKEHNEAKNGAHYTKIRRPVKLVHFEYYETLAAARKRETEIKKFRRDKKENLIKSERKGVS